MDTPTDTDTVTWENALLIPNLKLMPKVPLRLMPLPGIMLVTMDTPTDMDTTVWDTVDTMDIPTDTDTVTGDKGLLRIRTHTMVTIGGNLSRSCQFLTPLWAFDKPTTAALKNTEIFFKKHLHWDKRNFLFF